jgi:hypothetical protein
MIRLEDEDLADPDKLAAIAEAGGMTPEEVRERFGYLVEPGASP